MCQIAAPRECNIADGGYTGRNDDLFYGRSSAIPWCPLTGNLSVVAHIAAAADRQEAITIQRPGDIGTAAA